METVWGYRYEGGERTLDVHIRRLRRNLGPCGERIETLNGVGYRLNRSAQTDAAAEASASEHEMPRTFALEG